MKSRDGTLARVATAGLAGVLLLAIAFTLAVLKRFAAPRILSIVLSKSGCLSFTKRRWLMRATTKALR